jgi:hypothetical protein
MDNDSDGTSGHLTAFAGAEAALVEGCAASTVDGAAFQRKLSRCSLRRCGGTCCYDGVHVDDDTAVILQQLADQRPDEFRDMGLSLPDAVIVHEQWRGSNPAAKTAVKPFPFSSVVEDYPAHFNDTACVFLLEDARCGLQVLAERDGKHPWYYKPFSCWLHPILVSASEITLPDDQTDPYRFPDYDGFASKTFCGRTCDGGQPAAEVLRAELEFLGRLLRRDLLGAINPQT